MNYLKIRQLLNIKDCKFKAYVDSFNLYTRDKKEIMISNVCKDIIKSKDFKELTIDMIEELLNEKFDGTYIITKQEKEANIKILLSNLVRYQRWIKKNELETITTDLKGIININDCNIEVKANIVYKRPNGIIELVKIKKGKTSLSYKAKTQDNLPINDIELHCLSLLGKKIFPNKLSLASYHHLSGKKDGDKTGKLFYDILIDKSENELLNIIDKLENDLNYIVDKKEIRKVKSQIKTIKDVLYFENTEGNNVITSNGNSDLNKTILELYNTNLDKNSEKSCDYNRCSMCDYSTICNNKIKMQLNELKSQVKEQKEVNLTDEQKDVYNFNEGICKVLAGAGSGKSTTMAMRILRLIQEGNSPKHMLLITFTEKGAKELRDKVISLAKYYNIYFDYNDLKVYTFNSFGQTLIEKEWRLLGFEKLPTLATNIDTIDIIKELVEEYDDIEGLNYKNPLMNMPNYKGSLIQLQFIFSRIKSYDYNMDELESYLTTNNLFNVRDGYYSGLVSDIFMLYSKYNTILKNKNLIEYQDQIIYTLEILKQKLYTYGFEHIIVDEYQDTDKSQVNVLKELVKYNNFKSLMVVGDVDQSIFGFRNTTPENIINFEKEFNNVEIKYMVNNFRSTPQIVNLANNFISINNSSGDLHSVAKKGDGQSVSIKEFDTKKDEREYLLNLVKDKIKTNNLYDICIIGRTKKELTEIQELLENNNIPCNLRVSEKYIDNSQIQSILNLAYYFKDREKNYYLWEFLNINSNLTLEEINNVNECIKETFKNKNIEQSELIELFYNIVDSKITDKVAIDFMERIKQRTYYSLNELLTYLTKIYLYKDNTSIEKDDKKYNAITLTTAHGSKGLEWKMVIGGLNEYKYDNDIEETRRLLYVMMTRAMDELYLTYNKNMDKIRDKGKYSKFIDEISESMK